MTQYEAKLRSLAERDPNLFFLTAENRAHIRGLANSLGDRFVDVGIAEQTLVGMAAGLALCGKKPIVHALAAFLTMRSFEFIRTDIGIPAFPVLLVGFIPGVLSEANGPTHQALEDISLMRGIPGMQVFAPGDEEDLVQMLPSILESGKPAYMRYNPLPSVCSHQPFQPGKAEVISSGKDVILLTYGFMLREAYKALHKLKREGISVGLVNMRTLSPVDESVIVEAAASSALIVTLEDHFIKGGLYTIVAEVLLKYGMTTRVVSMAFKDRWFKPTLLGDILQYERMSGDHIAEKVARVLKLPVAPSDTSRRITLLQETLFQE